MRDCGCLTCHGFYAATLDVARVEEMVRLHPRGLLAIRTGAVSGTVVIDVDARGLPAMRQMIADGLLPRTLAQRTGSGYHLVYAHPGVRIASGPGKGGPGIDIKSDDAYIVVAPSVHPRTGRPYRWLGPLTEELAPLPQDWVKRLREPDRPALPARVPVEAVRGTRYAHRRRAPPARRAPRHQGGDAESTLSTRARSSSGSWSAPGCSTGKTRPRCWKTLASGSG